MPLVRAFVSSDRSWTPSRRELYLSGLWTLSQGLLNPIRSDRPPDCDYRVSLMITCVRGFRPCPSQGGSCVNQLLAAKSFRSLYPWLRLDYSDALSVLSSLVQGHSAPGLPLKESSVFPGLYI